MGAGVHSFILRNLSEAYLATDRLVLEMVTPTPDQTVTLARPWVRNAAPRRIHSRWERKPIRGWDFASLDPSSYFPELAAKGLKFLASYRQASTIEEGLATGLPFMLHNRFPAKSGVSAEAYRKLKQQAGDDFLGWVATEWDHCLHVRAKDRFEAYQQLEKSYKASAADVHNDVIAMTASGPWQHYSCEFGGTSGVMCEIGCLEVQLGLLFNRGAARQYGKPWYSYIAPCAHDAFSVTQPSYWRIEGDPISSLINPNGGLSVSHLRRLYYLSYLLGANATMNEERRNAFQTNIGGPPRLSPMGEMVREFYQFTLDHPDRGVSYTPFGIVLTKYHGDRHGCLYQDWYSNLAWELFTKTPANYSLEEFFACLYPGWKDVLNERNILVNTPYGEIFDTMLTTAPLEHLQAYKVLYLLGEVRDDMDNKFAAKLMSYVEAGGTVAVNSEHINENLPGSFLGIRLGDKHLRSRQAKDPATDEILRSGAFTFPEVKLLPGTKVLLADEKGRPVVTSRDYGRGRVIVTLPRHMLQDDMSCSPLLPRVLDHLSAGLLPFRLEGDIQYSAAKNKAGRWVIALANNKGIYKLANRRPPIHDKAKTARVRIVLPKRPAGRQEWYGDARIHSKEIVQGYELSLTIPPGEMKVLALQLGREKTP